MTEIGEMNMTTPKVKIDAEFQALIPPLTAEELGQLEENIQRDGCRDPLTVWSGKNILLDGHNRYAICKKMGIEYTVVAIKIQDRESAMDWIDANQLGRRNLTPDTATMLRGRRYNRIKKSHGGARISSAQNEPLKTAEKLAEQYGVSRETIKRDGQFAAAVDKAKAVVPDIEQAIMTGKAPPKKDVIKAAQMLEDHPKEAAAVLHGEKKMADLKREMRRSERVEKIKEVSQENNELNTGKLYSVIYADPPWRYEHSETESRVIENQYPTMSLDDICALNIPAHDDCVLFLWTTSPKLDEGLLVLKAWGFAYRTCAIWDKGKIGMGYYFRQQHELLLVGTKGNLPTPEPSNRPSSVLSYKRGKHSEKPAEIAEIIEKMYPEFDKLEMFCRSPRVGWDVWGNQSGA